jgi:hypothetical protein
MDSAERDAGYPVGMTTRQWQVIDAVVDNEVVTRAEEGDEHFADIGLRVREAGWDQVIGESGSWPPDDHVVTVILPLDQWGLVVSSLDSWAGSDPGEGALALPVLREVVSVQVARPLPEWPVPDPYRG